MVPARRPAPPRRGGDRIRGRQRLARRRQQLPVFRFARPRPLGRPWPAPRGRRRDLSRTRRHARSTGRTSMDPRGAGQVPADADRHRQPRFRDEFGDEHRARSTWSACRTNSRSGTGHRTIFTTTPTSPSRGKSTPNQPLIRRSAGEQALTSPALPVHHALEQRRPAFGLRFGFGEGRRGGGRHRLGRPDRRHVGRPRYRRRNLDQIGRR